MSRSYRVLALALVGVLVLFGLSRLVAGDTSADSTTADTASTSTTPTTPTTVAATSTTSAPSTTSSAAPAPAVTVPPSTAPATTAALGEGCTAIGTVAVIDRDSQRAWLCTDGRIDAEFPITSAWSMPDPGTYPVYAKDMNASSTFGGHVSTMTHFVAFSYGKNTGARVAFHSVPVLRSGEFVQPLDSVGDLSRRGESSGCIRVLPDDAVRIWDSLAIGSSVVVLN